MQFEQITLDDLKTDFSLPFHYASLDNDQKVYCKLDWLTVMFFDCSMHDVLKWIHLENSVSDFCSSLYQVSRGYDDVFKFNYNNVMLETSSFNFYGENLDISIFNVVVPKIRLELSGTGLDYLRSIGVNMDSYRLVAPDLPSGGSYHFTRADWAYDFINYKPEFIDRLIDHIHTHKLSSERVPLASTKSAISCKVVTGGQKTVYLGSPQSDRMLRVYDKRMQYVDLASGIYKNNNNPYGNPDSWIRIEWQTRNKFANNLVHGVDENGVPADFKSILKDIFDRYAFADGTCDGRHQARSCVDFWLDLFNWEELERRIVQNAKYVQYEAPDKKAIDSFIRALRCFIIGYSLLQKEGVEKAANEFLRALEKPDPSSYRRYIAFINKINEIPGFVIPDDGPDVHGLYKFLGRLYFKL